MLEALREGVQLRQLRSELQLKLRDIDPVGLRDEEPPLHQLQLKLQRGVRRAQRVSLRLCREQVSFKRGDASMCERQFPRWLARLHAHLFSHARRARNPSVNLSLRFLRRSVERESREQVFQLRLRQLH